MLSCMGTKVLDSTVRKSKKKIWTISFRAAIISKTRKTVILPRFYRKYCGGSKYAAAVVRRS